MLDGRSEAPLLVFKLRYWASTTLVVLGAVGFLGGALVALTGSRLPLRFVEFPLGDVQDIAVDAKGNILLALGFYGRIQLYDSQGRFQRSWAADARGGPFTVAFQSADLVASYAGRRDSTVLFNLSGDRVGEGTERPSPERRNRSLSISAPDGSVLSVHHAFLWPILVREKAGISSTVVTGPWYLRPVTGPLPTWLLMVFGALLHKGAVSRIWRRRKPAV